MKRRLPVILAVLGGTLLVPIIGLHLGAKLSGANLVVNAPSVAITIYALAVIGLALLVGGLVVLGLRRPPSLTADPL